MSTGVELATAWVRIVPSADGTTGNLTKELEGPAAASAETAGKKAGNKFSTGMKLGITVASAAIVKGVTDIFGRGMEEIKFGETINAQTDLLVKNTGFKMSTKQINDYTLSLANVSGIQEETLQQAGNNIIKFGDVSATNYKKAVKAVNDMGAAGKDAIGVSEALGKALADPAKAAGLLKRQGVILNDEQKKLIENFTKSGDKAGAQGVILDALNKTYGGMGEKVGGTLTGQLNKLNLQFDNIAGDVVSSLMPAIMGFVGVLEVVIKFMQDNPDVVMALAIAIGVLTAAIIAANIAMWAMSLNPIVLLIVAIVVAVGLLIAALVLLIMHWDEVVKWLASVWAGFVSWFTGVMDGFVAWWNALWAGVGKWITNTWNGFISWIVQVWSGFVSWIKGIVNGFLNWWNGVWAAVGKFFSDTWNNFLLGGRILLDGFNSFIRGLIGGIVSWWSGIWKSVGKVFSDVWEGLTGIVKGVWGSIVGWIRSYINTIIGIINGLIDGINAVAGTVAGVFGGSVHIGHIPMLAEGGTVTRSGWTVVGERGPELLKLDAGAQVNPNYDDLPSEAKQVVFNNYAPLGQSPAQALSQFANRAKGL